MIHEVFRVLWSVFYRRLFFLPLTATALALWLAPVISPDDTIPVRWLLYLAPMILWLIFVPVVLAAKLQLQAKSSLQPNFSLRDAFQHVMLRSIASIGTDPDEEEYYTNVESKLRDAARQGRLIVWARPLSSWPGGSKETLSPIKEEMWDHLKIDISTCIYDSKPKAEIANYGESRTQYLEDAQVNKHQVLREWPNSSRWASYWDPKFKHRLDDFEQERQGPVPGPPSCDGSVSEDRKD